MLALQTNDNPRRFAPGTVVVSIPERSLWVRAELRAEDGSMIALTNPIYIQHPLTTQSLLPE